MRKLYDIQGKPIKVGSLVAYLDREPHPSLEKQRVTRVLPVVSRVELVDGQRPMAKNCVVLEEPVWPNS